MLLLRQVFARDCDDLLQWLLTLNGHHYCAVAELWLAIATIDCSVFLIVTRLFVLYLSYLNTITTMFHNVIHKLLYSLWSRLCMTAWRNFYLEHLTPATQLGPADVANMPGNFVR